MKSISAKPWRNAYSVPSPPPAPSHLTNSYLATVHAIYTLSPKSPPSVLISSKPDGTPVAQVVVFDAAGTLVLMEEAGLSPSKIGIGRRSIAMEKLLAKMEATWAVSSRTPGNTRVGGLYYVTKPMLRVKGEKSRLQWSFIDL